MKPIAGRLLSDAEFVPQRRAFLATALGTAVGAALSIPLRGARAGADPAWPTRTVRFITLAAPGAGTDAVARTLADALSRRWGQPVVIDNRPGGDGIVSIETFLAAREGNHTLLFNPIGAAPGCVPARHAPRRAGGRAAPGRARSVAARGRVGPAD